MNWSQRRFSNGISEWVPHEEAPSWTLQFSLALAFYTARMCAFGLMLSPDNVQRFMMATLNTLPLLHEPYFFKLTTGHLFRFGTINLRTLWGLHQSQSTHNSCINKKLTLSHTTVSMTVLHVLGRRGHPLPLCPSYNAKKHKLIIEQDT